MSYEEATRGLARTFTSPEAYGAWRQGVGAGRPGGISEATLATSAASIIEDFVQKTLIERRWGEFLALTPNFLNYTFQQLDKIAGTTPDGAIWELRGTLDYELDQLSTALRMGILLGAGSGFSAYAESMMGTHQLRYLYQTLAINTAVASRMQRRYNMYWRPNWPDLHMAFQFFMRGTMTEDDVNKAGQWDGWPDDIIAKLKDVMYAEPVAREAFFMWRKGTMDETEFKRIVRKDLYAEKWYPSIVENYWYVPTLYDLCRLADFIEMDQTWATHVMKRRGMKDEDLARVWEMLRLRPNRSDVYAITNKWVWRFRMGRASLNELRDAFDDLELRSKQKELLLEKAQLDYEDELIDEKADILMWDFRNGNITDTEYMTGLVAIGINTEKANLMVELQKAMGYYGGYT